MFSWLGLFQALLSVVNNIAQFFHTQALLGAGRMQEKAANAKQIIQNKLDGDAAALDADSQPELDANGVPTDDGFRRD